MVPREPAGTEAGGKLVGMKHIFTAPQDGTYHVVTGQLPHLLYAECTAECGTLAGDGSAHPISVEFETSMPHLVAGDKIPEGRTEELHRITEAYLREHDMPVAGQRPTVALYNAAIDWWNGLQSEQREEPTS